MPYKCRICKATVTNTDANPMHSVTLADGRVIDVCSYCARLSLTTTATNKPDDSRQCVASK